MVALEVLQIRWRVLPARVAHAAVGLAASLAGEVALDDWL